MKGTITATAIGTLMGLGLLASDANAQVARVPVLLVIVDQNQDEQISQDEARQAREQQFSDMDQNKDEELARDEYGHGGTREETARQFSEADSDKDQSVSGEEYLSYHEQRFNEARDEAGGGRGDSVSIDDYAGASNISADEATAADKDQDQQISSEEGAFDTASRFRKLDTDNDGELTHSELRQSEMQLRQDREFSSLDQDGNDVVTRDEFIEATDQAYSQSDVDEDSNVSTWEYQGSGTHSSSDNGDGDQAAVGDDSGTKVRDSSSGGTGAPG